MLSKNVLNETNILIPYMYDKYIILILNTKSTYLYMKRICKKKKKNRKYVLFSTSPQFSINNFIIF